jgi:hypothetical protein
MTLPMIIDHRYLRILESAGLIMGPPRIKGMPLWAGRGLQVADRLAECFVSLVRERYPPAVTEHPFLMAARSYQAVFGDYGNVFAVHGPGGQDFLLRPDNMVGNVAALASRNECGPLVAGDGLLRQAPGKTPPLFRDQYIWPAVQLTHLVASGPESVRVLDFYRIVMERLLAAVGLPSITVETSALGSYGKVTYLTVSCMPSGQPTVLATLYVLSDGLRTAMRQSHAIVDVGFTGKILAVAAMHHVDDGGLILPSAIVPTQVGVIASTITPAGQLGRWVSSLTEAGIRVGVSHPCRTAGQRSRAEGRWLRRGVPLVIGLDRTHGAVRYASRRPLLRTGLDRLPDPATVMNLLAEQDARLLDSTSRAMRAYSARHAQVRALCGACEARESLPVFGQVIPVQSRSCEICGRADGRLVFISEAGRFY